MRPSMPCKKRRLARATRTYRAGSIRPAWRTRPGLPSRWKLTKVGTGPLKPFLGDYLQAVCVRDVTSAVASLGNLQSGDLTLLEKRADDVAPAANSATLEARVRNAPAAVRDMLGAVRTADTLDEALQIREQIGAAGSVITPDGVWLSEHWLRVRRDREKKTGVLGREHDLRRLKGNCASSRPAAKVPAKLLKDGRNRLTQLEERRDTLQRDASTLLGEYSEVKANLDAARYQMEQADARRIAVAEENRDIGSEARLQKTAQGVAAAVSAGDRSPGGAGGAERRAGSAACGAARELSRVREQADEDRAAAQNMAIQFESRRTSKESAAQSLARMQAQYAQFGRREEENSRAAGTHGEQPLDAKKQELERSSTSRRNRSRAVLGAPAGRRGRRRAARASISRACRLTRMPTRRAQRSTTRRWRCRNCAFGGKVSRSSLPKPITRWSPCSRAWTRMREADDWETKLERIRTRIDRLGPDQPCGNRRIQGTV